MDLTDCLQLRDEDLRAFAWASSEGVDRKFPDPKRDQERALKKILGARAAAAAARKAQEALEDEGGAGEVDTLGTIVVEETEELPERVASITRLVLDGCFNIGDKGIKSVVRRMRAMHELSICVSPDLGVMPRRVLVTVAG